MTTVIIWGLFVFVIDGCEGMQRRWAMEACWEGLASDEATDRRKAIRCLQGVGVEEFEIREAAMDHGFDGNEML